MHVSALILNIFGVDGYCDFLWNIWKARSLRDAANRTCEPRRAASWGLAPAAPLGMLPDKYWYTNRLVKKSWFPQTPAAPLAAAAAAAAPLTPPGSIKRVLFVIWFKSLFVSYNGIKVEEYFRHDVKSSNQEADKSSPR